MSDDPQNVSDVEKLTKQMEQFQTTISEQQEEIERLRNHSTKLLSEKKQLSKQYEGLGDPEMLHNILKQFQNDEDAKLFAEGKGTEVLKKHTERLKLDFQEQLDTLAKERDTYAQEKDTYAKKYHEEKAGHALRSAAAAAGVRDSAVDDILLRGKGIFTINEQNELEARDKDGNLVVVEGKALNPKLFIEGLRETYPHYWPESQSGGAHGGNGAESKVPNPFIKGSKAYNVTKQAELRRSQPDLAKQLEAEAQQRANA